MAQLEKTIADLQSTVSFDRLLIANKLDKHESINIDPSSRDFQRLDTDSGFFLVSLESVTAYLNGYKLMLDIGNPSDANFQSATISVTWSKPYDWAHYTDASYKQWQSAEHTQDFQVSTTLRAGTWNPVEVDLVPAAADELGFLQLSMKVKGVLLTTHPGS